jgi:signal peptidase II
MSGEEQGLESTGRPARVWRWTWITALIVIAVDQASKAWIRAHYEVGMPPRFDVFFHFTHQLNPGVVGGAFRNVPWVPRLAPFLGLIVLVYLYRQLDVGSRWQHLACGMILGGAVGNIIDRLWQHWAVTDFLQFNFMFLPEWVPWRYYPAFNVADSGVVVGVILLILTWRGKEHSDVARSD